MSKRELRGRLVLITGGGRGIGRATALVLSREGCRIAIADLDLSAAQQTQELVERAGGDARAYALDVSDRAAFDRLVERVEGEVAPIDVLINNAGIMTLGHFLDHQKRQDDVQLQVNLVGVINGMRAVLPYMQRRKRGHVVNIASMAGKAGIPHAAIYSATKFAVIGLTEAVRAELLDSGIDFTYVMPALVRTELIAGAGRPRWPPVVTPEAVAEGILGALRTRRVDVYVPKAARISEILPTLLPRALLDRLGKLLRVDTMFARVDSQKRAGYVARTEGKADAEPSLTPRAPTPSAPTALEPRPTDVARPSQL